MSHLKNDPTKNVSSTKFPSYKMSYLKNESSIKCLIYKMCFYEISIYEISLYVNSSNVPFHKSFFLPKWLSTKSILQNGLLKGKNTSTVVNIPGAN